MAKLDLTKFKKGSRIIVTQDSSHHLYQEAAPEVCDNILSFFSESRALNESVLE